MIEQSKKKRIKQRLLTLFGEQIDQAFAEVFRTLTEYEEPESEACSTGQMCFDCGNPADHWHHVVPRSMGGTNTVPLCNKCHGKVHGRDKIASSKLIKLGLEKARARGVKLGRRRKDLDIERIKKLKADGYSLREIAQILMEPRSSIHDALQRASPATISRIIRNA